MNKEFAFNDIYFCLKLYFYRYCKISLFADDTVMAFTSENDFLEIMKEFQLEKFVKKMVLVFDNKVTNENLEC